MFMELTSGDFTRAGKDVVDKTQSYRIRCSESKGKDDSFKGLSVWGKKKEELPFSFYTFPGKWKKLLCL